MSYKLAIRLFSEGLRYRKHIEITRIPKVLLARCCAVGRLRHGNDGFDCRNDVGVEEYLKLKNKVIFDANSRV
jgi:hypothetical protein